jgi:hypothetical protein
MAGGENAQDQWGKADVKESFKAQTHTDGTQQESQKTRLPESKAYLLMAFSLNPNPRFSSL